MVSKQIIVDRNKGAKFNGDNYYLWHCKIQFMLDEYKVLNILSIMMAEPKKGSIVGN
jgi:hypothetical protein